MELAKHDRRQSSGRGDGGEGFVAEAEGRRARKRNGPPRSNTPPTVMRGAKAQDAFPDFLKRKGIAAE